MSEEILKSTPLEDRHIALGARMVPFAGYNMPVQYEGVLAEHKWTRASAGLFDVSHMGQARITGEGAIATLEALTPTDFAALKAGRQKYALLLAEDGGILDDWMVSRPEAEGFFLVVNAACKDQDFEIIADAIADDENGPPDELEDVEFEVLTERALLALQGPKAKDVMRELCPAACDMYFMDCGTFELLGETAFISRSGYTGEDGFEISFPAERVGDLWDELLSSPLVKPIGLGARDSLRLEAGMPLYGHEMDAGYTLVEANLGFAMQKSRLERGDIRGIDRIRAQLGGDLARVRVAIRVLAGPPAREGAKILDGDGEELGVVTSGVPSPSLGVSIAMGYVPPAFSAIGTAVQLEVRGKPYAAEIVSLPFVANGYHRQPKS
ncbi:glycine cleavage system aminomethyltransferase GcvT [Asticcacaulis sp. EMRT-3]|uniref:glycine cleavage system aminomethyltransferase GcvT n=1 Tax=Asticcacaulis sp. EMRT-3 TaxID=3040349 RepID=UPI0024AFF85A|nr:glycine cleavage system aminomethyltransferase GcvT [Asticcacaulis sp. EMRT-3]MDI7774201.1 glycine cleavage system aminomethyltransferase GcvT [Asticcacaulis sp. EMRT-3]